MNDFAKIDKWIERQKNDQDFYIRLPIPGFSKFKLFISPKQKKCIHMYHYDDTTGKVTYPKLGEFPYLRFEEAFLKRGSIGKKDKATPILKFRDIWNRFIEENPKGFKENTLRTFRVRGNKYILNTPISSKNIEDITIEDLQIHVFNPVSKESPTTNQKLAAMVRNVFKYAKRENLIKNNPLAVWRFCDEYDNSRRNVQHHEKIISPELLGKFLKDVADSKVGSRRKILIYFALETGLRSMNIVGENGVRWRDIDFEKKYIFFEKSRMKGEKRTEKSRQDFILPLSNTMISLLMEIKRLNKPSKNDRIFENIADSTINQILKRIAGITKHGLRGTLKTFATKNLKNHKTPNFIIEMYLYHAPSMSEVEMAYSELLYKDPEIQAQLRDFAEWWDQYLLSLFNFKKALLGEENEL